MTFFELIQVALGNRDRLSVIPSAEEWRSIYAESERQAVTGIILHGIDRLKNLNTDINLNQQMLLQWIGIGQMLEQRNRLMDERCVELLGRLKDAGLDGTILKGQGIAQYYPKEIQKLRQPGDIDVYVDCGYHKALDYARSFGQKDVEWDYKHLHLKVWDDTEVEMHYRIEVLLNLWKNRKLQWWFCEQDPLLYGSQFMVNGCKVTIPSVEFNVFYILLHIYRHFLYEGVGLRQIVDYYMVLRMIHDSQLKVNEYVETVREFGMVKFAKGLMWVMHEALGMPCDWMLWKPDEREGRYILKQVMTGGNFGHHDKRLTRGDGKISAVKAILTHNMHLLIHYPLDVIWAPVWIVWHKLWKLARV